MNIYDYYITPEEYEIAEKNGISRATLECRVRDLMWDKKRAITEPPQKKDYSNKKYADIAEKNGINRNTFYSRVRRGMCPKEACTKPLQDKRKWAKEMRERRRNKLPKTIYETARKNGITYPSLMHRLKSPNFTFEEAYTLPPLSYKECAKRAHESRRKKSENKMRAIQ